MTGRTSTTSIIAASARAIARALDRLRRPTPQSPAPAAAPIASELPHPRPDDHLARLTGIIASAARHGERASTLHEYANRRIDSALYELDQLRLELGAVVDPHLLKETAALLAASADVLREPAPTAEASAPMAARGRSARSAA